jgi:hypothetical protein
MKMRFFFAALIYGALAIGASLADERKSTPVHATDGNVASPTDNAGGHQTTGPGESRSSAQTPPDAAGERPGVDGHDKSNSKALKPGTEADPTGPTHDRGLPTGRNGRDDNPMPANPIDTRITVNQGRSPENNKKAILRKQGGAFDKASRANPQKGIHVPRPISRSGLPPGPARDAIGVVRLDTHARAGRLGTTAPTERPGAVGAKSVVPVTTGTNVPGAGTARLSAPATGGRSEPGTSATGRRIGYPGATLGPASAAGINGTEMGHASRVGEIGGAAKTRAGINGSSVRPKRP